MLKIRIYSSISDAAPIETHKTSLSFSEWLSENIPSYDAAKTQPISAYKNGRIVPAPDWAAIKKGAIDVRVNPQGGFGAILSVIFPVFAFANIAFTGAGMLAAAGTPSFRQGKELESNTIRANIPKLNDTVPDLAGRFKRYPDTLVPVHRKFISERVQQLEIMLCVGIGRYQIQSSRVQIGDTPLISLGGDADFTIYEPGDDVSADTASEFWYSVKEVGSTASLSAGLKLEVTESIEPTATSPTYNFDGYDITLANVFPDGWEPGITIRVEQYQDYVVTGGTTITGPLDDIELFAGMYIEIAGPNAGFYIVDDINSLGELTLLDLSSNPVDYLANGVLRMAIGYSMMRYLITGDATNQITVSRLDENGDEDLSWLGWDLLTTTDAVLTIYGDDIEGGWVGPYAACPAGEVTDEVEIDVLLPQGLFRIDGDGNQDPTSATFEYQWRELGSADPWDSVEVTLTKNTRDQLGYTYTLPISPSYRPEVRMRKIGSRGNIQWFGLRSKLVAPSSYDDVTTMSIRLNVSDRLGAQSENQINLIATRVLPVRNGGMWDVDTPTRSPAAYFAYVLKSIGYTDAQIGLDELDVLNDVWDEREDYYDWVHDETTVKDVLNQCLAAGFSNFTIENGQVIPVRDQIRTDFEQMYTPQNMTRPMQRSVKAITPDEIDGVDVEYTDESNWSKQTVECRLPGDLGTKTDKLKIDGVVDRDKAWRIGMRARRIARYRRLSYEFSTELDAMNSSYLSYVALADDTPGYGKSCILMAVEESSVGHILTLSEPIEFDTSSDYIIAIRRDDGTLDGPYPVTQGDNEFEVIADLDSTPAILADREPPHVLIGTEQRCIYPALVAQVKPSGSDSVSVSAVNYDERVYEDDDSFAPS